MKPFKVITTQFGTKRVDYAPHPTCGKPKKYPEGTTKKTYCLPTHKFEEADKAIRKLLDRF